MAHAVDQRAARVALAARVDSLAHLFVDRPADDDFVSAVVAAGAFVVPTLTMLESQCGRSGDRELAQEPQIARYLPEEAIIKLSSVIAPAGTHPDLDFEHARQAVRMLRSRGVPVLAGTDAIAPGTANWNCSSAAG